MLMTSFWLHSSNHPLLFISLAINEANVIVSEAHDRTGDK